MSHFIVFILTEGSCTAVRVVGFDSSVHTLANAIGLKTDRHAALSDGLPNSSMFKTLILGASIFFFLCFYVFQNG